MIYKGMEGFPTDQTGDGGDSSMRAGVLALCGSKYSEEIDYSRYEKLSGQLTRHPSDTPWDNPKNFSRDQMLVLVAGLAKLGLTGVIRRVFYARMRQCFFAQNFERDAVGTTKYPWPHIVEGEKRNFDFADPLLPNHVGTLILGGEVWWAYFLLPICYVVHLLFLTGHMLSKNTEENQQIAECYMYRTLGVYKRFYKNWKPVSENYWGKRHEMEYHIMLRDFVNNGRK